MVISGLGLNLFGELAVLSPKMAFPIEICLIILPIQVIVFSLPFCGFKLGLLRIVRRPQSSLDLDNRLLSSERPNWYALVLDRCICNQNWITLGYKLSDWVYVPS
jgi:hypothetical protein